MKKNVIASILLLCIFLSACSQPPTAGENPDMNQATEERIDSCSGPIDPSTLEEYQSYSTSNYTLCTGCQKVLLKEISFPDISSGG